MENLRPIKFKNFLGGVAFGVLLVAVLFSTVGCSKNKSASAYNRGYGWWGNGGFNGNPNFPYDPNFSYGPVGVGYDFDGNEVYLEFGLPMGANYQDPYFYTGQVMLTGGIHMNGKQCVNGSMVPPGQYQVYARQPSQAQNGIVSGAQLIAQGPGAQLVLALGWAHIESPGVLNPNFNDVMGLTATITVQSVNGIQCGSTMGVSPGGF
jgi:hypothetical protein